MAIFIPGMTCVISGKTISSSNEAVMFPPFVANEADPLFIFSDSVVHVDAFRTHHLASEAQARYTEFREQNSPRNRICAVCGKQITNPDDYLSLGYLTDDLKSPLFDFNYAHFHRACVAQWPHLNNLLSELENFQRSGAWKGDSLKSLIRELGQFQP